MQLNGAAEIPSVASRGGGSAIIAFHGDSRVCWRFAHLHEFTSATSARIQVGAEGQSGKVIVSLSSGPRLHHHGCVPISPVLSRAIWSRPDRYFVNIESNQYPGGAVRAQL